jgi:hypothetical protein
MTRAGSGFGFVAAACLPAGQAGVVAVVVVVVAFDFGVELVAVACRRA